MTEINPQPERISEIERGIGRTASGLPTRGSKEWRRRKKHFRVKYNNYVLRTPFLTADEAHDWALENYKGSTQNWTVIDLRHEPVEELRDLSARRQHQQKMAARRKKLHGAYLLVRRVDTRLANRIATVLGGAAPSTDSLVDELCCLASEAAARAVTP